MKKSNPKRKLKVCSEINCKTLIHPDKCRYLDGQPLCDNHAAINDHYEIN